jgi:hypothetical protein
MEKLTKNSTPVSTPISSTALAAASTPNKNLGFTPEEIAWWKKTILDGHKNRHLNNR